MVSEKHVDIPTNSTLKRLINSPTVACIAGSLVLWTTFGVRQSFGVFLIPITTGVGWDRATFSTAIGLLQILWGVSQPFLAFLAGIDHSAFIA
ncbi:hypothetical protein BC937DRAFT_93330 [Endogone sp. FLAS-F59071]|nr:hypothetical protein BC937DRAFT_93330 [Endogone sp. FLAS-F59071]|eukprot:RUS14792.1 hypothetical protein BC937DRAFT_93330 [Endogone sp. FLAS-F59071]